MLPKKKECKNARKQLCEPKENLLLKQYFNLYDQYVLKFGKKVLILMEVGTFYEMRGSDENDECTGGYIRELAYKLNIRDYYLNNKCIPEIPSRTNPICLGFPNMECSELNYIPKIVEEGFWVVIVKQKEISEKNAKTKKFERNVVRVINKATLLGGTMSSNQNIMVVFNEVAPLTGVHCIGKCCLHVISGKLTICEGTSSLYEKTRTIEDLERWIHMYRPMQVIWIDAVSSATAMADKEINIKNLPYAKNVLRYEDIPKLHNINYQEQIIRRYFARHMSKSSGDMVDAIDNFGMTYTPNARMALMFLIQFLWDTNEDLLHGMQRPEFENYQESFILEKNAIKQLHIHEFCENIVKCQTSMGKQLLQERMSQPSNDVNQINGWLDMVAVCDVRLRLSVVSKFHFIVRRMSTKTSTFRDLKHLWENLSYLKNLPLNEKMLEVFGSYKNLDPILDYLNVVFDKIVVMSQDLWIFRDRLLEEQTPLKYMSYGIRFFQKELNKRLKGEHVFLKETKLEGLTFQGNKSKVTVAHVMNDFADIRVPPQEEDSQNLIPEMYQYLWSKDTVKPKMIGGKQAFIHSELSIQYVETKEQLQRTILNELQSELKNIYDQFEDFLHEIISNIAKLDVGMATNELAVNSNYVRPVLMRNSLANKGSYFNAKNLRHPIIEKTLLNSTYVPNHFKLTDETPGLVIYGINSSGKSSAMRSVGLSVVMAQAGLFVPASYFELAPFHNVLTRIMGGDDMMRGASSYTIEILECRPIATRATPNTLMLGDEIGHSTEVTSGSALVSSLMDHMAERKTKFVIATHMRALETLTDPKHRQGAIMFKHIHVGRDERGNLLFDRVLRDGTGPDTYGLDIAEYLGMDGQIIFAAHKKIQKIKKYPNTLVENVSKYNSRKLHDPICVTPGCDNLMEEEDHIEPQYLADENGFLSKTHVHKNTPSNLQGLCKKCHTQKTKQDIKNLKRIRAIENDIPLEEEEEDGRSKKKSKIYDYMIKE